MKRGTGRMGWGGVAVAMGVAAAGLLGSCAPAQPVPGGRRTTVSAAGGADATADKVDGGVQDAGAEGAQEAGPRELTICNAVLCSNYASISVVLPVPSQEIADARVYLSVGTEHFETRRPRPIDTVAAESYMWDGPESGIRQRVVSLDARLSRLEIGLAIPPELAIEHQTYTVRVVAPGWRHLLNVTRRMATVPVKLDPYTCPQSCKAVTMRLYSNSASGITCDSNECESGLELRLKAPLMVQQMDGVRVCLNRRCADAHTDGIELVRSRGLDYHYWFGVPFHTSRMEFLMSSSELVFHIYSDPIVLADGDKYTITFYKSHQPIGKFEKVVRYESSFPNGQQCDTVPCKRATVQAQL